ncbi:DUF4062 domain-containing protein [Microbacterium laevaniformans]|uniref:DUF4062 domain-containing protein n=1 Tax=Microbacterium laevaniformans TaxID=36807 RepID=UPI00363CD293
MVFSATVVCVMIASPGDVAEAREATYSALNSWNDANATNRGIILLPLRWETSAVPETGNHPQDILNHQVVARADVVIALFGVRVGAETPNALSGTVEEIEGALGSGKPVHVYFSGAPLPNDVDIGQLSALRAFKSEFQMRGLFGSFANPDELRMKIWQAIEADLAKVDVGSVSAPAVGGDPVVIRVQPQRDTSIKTDGRGRISSKENYSLEVRNESNTSDAEALTLATASDRIFQVWEPTPRTLHAGQSRRYGFYYTGGDDPDPKVTVSWVENGEEKSKTFSI